MQKIKDIVIEKMIAAGLTSREVDFVICISHYQDDTGRITGVYYQDICNKINISYQKFYDTLKSLEAKRIIKAAKGSYYDWDITILDNDFSSGDFSGGYLSTRHAIFSDNAFKPLKANEKLLAMKFMRITQANGGKYNIGVSKFVEKYTKILSVSKRILAGYLRSLKTFFSIGRKKTGQLWIEPLKRIYGKHKIGEPTDKDLLHSHIGRAICRRVKAAATNPENFKDTCRLLEQYKKIYAGRVTEALTSAINKSLELINRGRIKKKSWNRELQPKLINKIMAAGIIL